MKSKILHVVQTPALRWWFAPGFWALFLFAASSIPGTSYPEVSFQFADKLVHIGIYGVLAALLMCAAIANFRWSNLRLWLFALGVGSLYGATDELHQAFVPNRSSDVRDLVADVVGAALGAAFVLCFIGVRKRLGSRTRRV